MPRRQRQRLSPLNFHGLCRANVAHTGQSRPESCLGFDVKVGFFFNILFCPEAVGLPRIEESPLPGEDVTSQKGFRTFT